jgi:hypothetical protein
MPSWNVQGQLYRGDCRQCVIFKVTVFVINSESKNVFSVATVLVLLVLLK